MPAAASDALPPAGTSPRASFGEAVKYWELRRIPYNLLLAALVGAWVRVTWPVFRPAVVLPHLPELLVLALLANLCYCAAYIVELSLARSPALESWRRRRWALWVAGVLLALLIAHYWIGDEIYPDALRQLP